MQRFGRHKIFVPVVLFVLGVVLSPVSSVN